MNIFIRIAPGFRPVLQALAFAGIVWIGTSASAALACSTCSCGDNTITLMGAEKPYAGRLRVAVDYAVRSETMGSGVNRQDIDEERTNFGLSYSFDQIFTLGLQLPLVHKHVADATLRELDTRGLGDADLIGRLVVFRDRPQFSRHMAGLRLGVRLPTSEEVKDSQGNVIDIDAQPDAGATAPNLGLWYGYYAMPVFVGLSAFQMFYNHGRQGFDPGDATVGSLTLQYGLSRAAFQIGLDGRHTDRNEFSGTADPDSGGTLAMAAGGVAWRFGTDFVINAGVQVPVVKNLNGVQDEDSSWHAGFTHDF